MEGIKVKQTGNKLSTRKTRLFTALPTNKQTNKQTNVNGKPAGLFLPEGPAPFARTPRLSKRP